MPDKEFGPGVRYDTGQHTSIAINSSNRFVEVHRTHIYSDFTLWYHTGIINETGIHWSPPRQYEDNGDTPSVGANDKFAAEVHTVGARGVSDDQIVIACRLGVFGSEHPRQLTWEPQVELGYGIEPKIAVAPDGTVIMISGDRYVAGQMTYRPGRIDAQTKRIVWGAPHRTDYADNGLGVPGGIALTNDRKFVAVFRGGNRQLRYQTGRIDDGVAYLGSVWSYDKGENPSICLAENGSFVEVHQSENEATLWVRHGSFDGTTLDFAEQVASQYDTGMEPSVTCNEQHVLSTHKSPGHDDDDNRLFYNLGRSLDQVLTGH